jgi:hypothetical protein
MSHLRKGMLPSLNCCLYTRVGLRLLIHLLSIDLVPVDFLIGLLSVLGILDFIKSHAGDFANVCLKNSGP